MDAAEFKRGLETLWGPRWGPKAIVAFDSTRSTLNRWANGHLDRVPGAAGRLMETLLENEKRRLADRRHEQASRQRKRLP